MISGPSTDPGAPGWPPDAPADRSALLVDFDGTLAPIVDDPAFAAPLPGAVAALGALAGRLGLVAVVTGRPVAAVRRHLADPRIVVVGQYGLEREVDGVVVPDPRVVPFAPAVAALADEATDRWPALRVERKGTIACTLHWRERPDAAPAAIDLTALAERHGLDAWPARMACEFRPPVAVDKGTAVTALLASDLPEAAWAGFVGDDHGDLVAFDALRTWADAAPGRRSCCVAVASVEAPADLVAAADLVVDGPADLEAMLDRWRVVV